MGSAAVRVDELMRRGRWPVLRRLGFHPGGDERSSLRGTGIEYSDVREYQAGDDPRSIEWNITARSAYPRATQVGDDMLREAASLMERATQDPLKHLYIA